MSFSENLMRLRKSKGLSQEEFANEINVSRQTVSKWELGTSTPEMDKLVQISKFFNISVDDLVNSEDATGKVSDTTEINSQNQSVYNDTNINAVPKKSSSTSAKIFAVLLIGVIITIITALIILLIRDFNEKKDTKSTNNKSNNTTSNIVENKIENKASNSAENKVENNIIPSEFNSGYHNGRTEGEDVEKDLSKIITSNKTNKSIKISVEYDSRATSNPEEITEIKKGIDLDSYYEIALDYDNDGYISKYKIEVAEKTQTEKIQDAKDFNFYFNRGSRHGFHIGYDLERVITSNMEHPDKQIYVKYNDTETNEKEGIKSIKSKLETHTQYNIEFEYDSDGYINKYIIENE
ncbi:MAG: helix-turn-helix transcriptional regulator [Clostridia bacterium]|nr:helix-turn-helix transcriptional regulator [Clostridia bacterium]